MRLEHIQFSYSTQHFYFSMLFHVDLYNRHWDGSDFTSLYLTLAKTENTVFGYICIYILLCKQRNKNSENTLFDYIYVYIYMLLCKKGIKNSEHSIWLCMYVCICVCVCMKYVKVLVTQLCLTPCNPMNRSPPGSSVLGILQARTLAGCHSLLQGIFLTWGLNWDLLHWRWILHLCHQGSP